MIAAIDVTIRHKSFSRLFSFTTVQRDVYGFSLSPVAAENWNSGGHAEGGAHHHHPGDILPHSVWHVFHVRLQLRQEANSRSQDHTGQCHEVSGCAETASLSHDYIGQCHEVSGCAETGSLSHDCTGQCHELSGCAKTGSLSHNLTRLYVTEGNLQSQIREVWYMNTAVKIHDTKKKFVPFQRSSQNWNDGSFSRSILLSVPWVFLSLGESLKEFLPKFLFGQMFHF